MSEVIDSKVVEMQFDNKQFEEDVRTTMSTLDKFKSKFNFKEAANGISELGKASEKVTFSGMANGLETVKIKFSSLQAVGFTCLQNITNAAINTGKRLESALTIEPVKSGFDEYETQINAVQTILNNTKRYGTTLTDVNNALDALNTYADQTIYNFTQMTKSIGMFTTAGIDLQTSVNAVKGIANLAAYVGAPAEDASRAMYQLSQALSSGSVRLQDWISLENTAGMAGKEFQDRLIATSRVLGTGVDEAIEANGNFRESLKEGWLTTEVLNETLSQFAGSVDRASLAAKGFSVGDIDSILQLGEDATKAATKVKTFTQLIDTLKEALGSGWTQTWRLIIGDFEEAQEVWTKVSDTLGGMINNAAEARNKLVAKVMGNPYADILSSISDIAVGTDGIITSTKKYKEIVNSVIRGSYGNGQPRFDKLAKEGYNWAKVQNMVNEQLGNSYRYNEELGKSQEELNKTQATTIEQLLKMSDAQLRQNGLEQDEIDALRELEKQSKKTGIPLNELLKDMSKLDGRSLLIGTFENAGKSLLNIFTAMKKGWSEIFEPASAITVYNILANIHKLSVNLLNFTNTRGSEIERTVAGIVALFDILRKTVTGGLKLGFNALNVILGVFDMDILDASASLGDLLVSFDRWLDKVDPITQGFTYIGEGIKWTVDKIKELYDWLMTIPAVRERLEGFKEMLPDLGEWFGYLKEGDFSKIGDQLVNGLENGLKKAYSLFPKWMIELGGLLINTLKDVLGIHSPSKKTYEIALDYVQGFINGLVDAFKKLSQVATALFDSLIADIQNGNVDWNKLFTITAGTGITAGFGLMIKEILSIFQPIKSLDGIFDGAGDILKGVSEGVPDLMKNLNSVVTSFGKVNKAKAFKTRCDGIKEVLFAIAVVSGAVILLGRQSEEDLKKGLKSLIAIAAVVAVLTKIMNTMSDDTSSIDISSKKIKFNSLNKTIRGIGTAMVLMAASVKLMGGMSEEEMKKGFTGLAGLVGGVTILLAAYGKLVKGDSGKDIDKAGKMISKISKSMILMVGVVKLASMLDNNELIRGAEFAGGFAIFVGALCQITKNNSEQVNKTGKFIRSVVIAMGLMVGVMKLVSGLSKEEAFKGALFAAAFLLFIKGLTKVTSGYDKDTKGLSRLLLSMSFSMAIMAGVVKLIGQLSPSDMLKGALFMAGFLLFVKELTKATTIGNTSKTAKLGGTLLGITVCVGLLAGIAFLLGSMDTESLAKGVIAVGILCGGMTAMVKQLKGAKEVKASLIVLAVAVGVMAAAVYALSTIDTEKLFQATGALAILMGVFAYMEKMSSNANMSIKTAGIMVLAIGAIAYVLYKLGDANANASVSNALALSTVLMALAAATTILSKAGNVSNDAYKTVGVMGLALVGIAFVLGIMDKLNVSGNMENALALSTLLIGISAAAVILSKIGPVASGAATGAGKLIAVIGLAGLIFAAVGGLIGQIDGAEEFLDKGITVLEKIGECLGSFFGGIVAGFSTSATSGLEEVGNNIVGFVNSFTEIDDGALGKADQFVSLVAKITEASFLDSLSRFLTFGQGGLAGFGKQCSKFGESIGDLCDALDGVDLNTDTIQKAIDIGTLLSDFKDSLTPIPGLIQGWFIESQNLGKFGKQCSTYGKSIKKLVNALDGLDLSTGSTEKAIAIGELLRDFQKSLDPAPGAILKLFSFSKDLGDFGKDSKSFITSIIELNDNLKGVNIDNDKIEQATKAGQLLSGLKNGLTEDPGDFIKMFVKYKDLEGFGDQCKEFGKSMKKASESFSGLNIDLKGVQSAADAAELLNGLKTGLGDTPGLIAGLFKDLPPDLGDFGEQCETFGKAMKEASNALTDEDGNPVVNTNSVQVATNAGTMLAKLQEAIPEKEWFSGKVDLEDFGSQIKSFGEGMDGFSDEVKDINKTEMNDSLDVASDLVDLAKNVGDTETFGTQVSAFSTISTIGGAFKAYSENIADVAFTDIIKSISVGYSLSRFVSSLSSFDSSGLTDFKSAIDSLGNVEITNIQNTLSQRSNEFASTGKTLVEVLSDGMTEKKGKAVEAMNKIINEMKDKILSYKDRYTAAGVSLTEAIANGLGSRGYLVHNAAYSVSSYGANGVSYSINNFYNNGINLAAGLINGINAMRQSVWNSAYALGQLAVLGERAGQQSHSPSKATEQSGIWLGEGLINGISSMFNRVKASGNDLGKAATNAIDEAVSEVSKLIDSDLDNAPVISPVVDITNAKAGMAAIQGLFNESSLNAVGNITAITNGERNKSQNGNEDIINAINSLGRNLDNRGDTYHIDGITYSNGTEVEDAVKVLVRAATMERRR